MMMLTSLKRLSVSSLKGMSCTIDMIQSTDRTRLECNGYYNRNTITEQNYTRGKEVNILIIIIDDVIISLL